MRPDFPFSAVVGQDELKLALLLVAVDPTIGGVLITGERGTAKSTVARGLAALLPATAAGHAAPFVQLPLGATEDRVVGSLDLSKVLQDGSSQLRSGVLTQADAGILYVDEVNLLPDHLVDLLLDAAASGYVIVERDGISARQPARFVLVGTMNPEEGTLRPQFADRFGLCVEVRGLKARDVRKAAIRQRLSFDDDARGVLGAMAAAEQRLRDGIVAARARLCTLGFTDAHLDAIVSLSLEHRLDGIRGDLAILKTARALAAWEAAESISEDHLRRAAGFALPHRTKRAPSSTPKSHRPETRAPSEVNGIATGAGMPGADPTDRIPSRLQPAPPDAAGGSLRLITDIGDRSADTRDHMVSANARRAGGTVPFQTTGSLAVAETLSAAAIRGARVGGGGLRLDAADLRQHELGGSDHLHVLFLVDASSSMATHRRLAVAKGAALGLLSSSDRRREQVALMAFRAEGTDLVLPFTHEVARVEAALRDVPTGGRTPLARALLDAQELLRSRRPSLLVLLTDGRANVSAAGGDPWEETLAAGALLRGSCSGALVIDCELGLIALGRARLLAQALGAERVALDEIDDTSLTLRIHKRLVGL